MLTQRIIQSRKLHRAHLEIVLFNLVEHFHYSKTVQIQYCRSKISAKKEEREEIVYIYMELKLSSV